MMNTSRMPRGAASRVLLAALAAAALAGGCSSKDGPTQSDYSFSSVWDGNYSGGGCFTNRAEFIIDRDLDVTVRVHGLGDDWINVQLFLTPDLVAYNPSLNLAGKVSDEHRAELIETHDVFIHHGSLSLSADGTLQGTLWVTSPADGTYWSCVIGCRRE